MGHASIQRWRRVSVTASKHLMFPLCPGCIPRNQSAGLDLDVALSYMGSLPDLAGLGVSAGLIPEADKVSLIPFKETGEQGWSWT